MIETIDSGQYMLKLNKATYGRRVPTSAQIEITRRCPLTCAHCYNNLPLGDLTAKNSELSYQELCRMMDELAELGSFELNFTGGEIFGRPDFLDIYTYAKKKGFIITLFTNGVLITPEIADYLVKWRPYSIEITLYGRTRETYEQLTGVVGSYDKCLRGIRLLLDRGLPLKLKTVATTINQHEVHDIKDLARELGMEKDFQYDATMVPRVDCSSSPLAVRLSPESTIALEAKDPAKFTDWKNFLESHWSSEINRTFVKEKVYICGAAKTGIFVNHNGMTSGCNYTQGDVYDWRKGSLQKAWDYLDEVVVNRKRTLVTKCVECRLRPGCSSCPAKSELENGHLELPVEHICHSTHLRAYVAGIEMLPHGDCDFCPGGSHYQQLQDEAFRIKSNFVMPQRKFLPVLAAALTAQSSGCHGCGS